MKSSAKKVELASVDDLFSTEESRADAQREKVVEIPLSELPQLRPLAYKADNRKKNNEKGGQPESCPRKPGGRLFRLLYAYET